MLETPPTPPPAFPSSVFATRRSLTGLTISGLLALSGLAAIVIAFAAERSAGVPVFGRVPLPELRAELGSGDFVFLPNRRGMWVVHPQLGRLIHYRFLDSADGAVERSFVAEFDLKLFPPADSTFVLSENNLTDLLWIGNRQSGDFQLWRRNVRDGRLITDPVPVAAERDLVANPSIKSSLPPARQ